MLNLFSLQLLLRLDIYVVCLIQIYYQKYRCKKIL